jgi:cysteinyl-tRNA synthetase
MAKRIGNVATVGDLQEQRVSAAAFRHFVFSAHYRTQLNLSPEALEASIEGVRRVGDFSDRLSSATGGTSALATAAEEAVEEFSEALFDDLNAPLALSALFNFIRKANAELDSMGDDANALEIARRSFDRMNGVLDILPELEPVAGGEEIEARLAERKAARERRDFATADAIRRDLEKEGIAIEDGPRGTRWKRVR